MVVLRSSQALKDVAQDIESLVRTCPEPRNDISDFACPWSPKAPSTGFQRALNPCRFLFLPCKNMFINENYKTMPIINHLYLIYLRKDRISTLSSRKDTLHEAR